MNDILILIFKDSFLANFIFTFDFEFAYTFAKAYEGKFVYDALSFCGAISGLMASYFIMYGFAKVFAKYIESSYNYKPLKHYFEKFKYLFLIASVFPNLSILAPFFSGLLKLNPIKFLFIISTYKIIYYLYLNYELGLF